jgi:acetyl-CoA acetyltransferase
LTDKSDWIINIIFVAAKAGIYKDEIVPVEVKGRKGPELVSEDEHPRAGLEIASISKLRSVFKKDGVVSAANASGINDGAAALIVASEDAVKKYGLTPLARVVSWQASAVEPTLMGLGPVPSINGALKRAKLELSQMGLIEVNEAFAAQYLACEKELGLTREITNVNGGAIAIGHPLGASGARILTHLSHALQRTKEKYAVGSACIGGGQVSFCCFSCVTWIDINIYFYCRVLLSSWKEFKLEKKRPKIKKKQRKSWVNKMKSICTSNLCALSKLCHTKISARGLESKIKELL